MKAKLHISLRPKGTHEEKDNLRDQIIFLEKLVAKMKKAWEMWEWEDE